MEEELVEFKMEIDEKVASNETRNYKFPRMQQKSADKKQKPLEKTKKSPIKKPAPKTTKPKSRF